MIYLIRHGLDDEAYVGGYSDVSLLEEGKKEIQNIACFIKNNLSIEKIYTSDIKRAIETVNYLKNQ